MSAIEALYGVLYPYLRDYPANAWNGRVQPVAMATASLDKPHLLFFHAGGGTEFSVPVRDVESVVLSVKVVADTMQTAVDGMTQIKAALKDSGVQDVNPRLPSATGWTIKTVTEGRRIWLEEAFEGTQRIYHAGYQYSILMEAI